MTTETQRTPIKELNSSGVPLYILDALGVKIACFIPRHIGEFAIAAVNACDAIGAVTDSLTVAAWFF